jgi:hypothetical protein
VRAKPFTCPDCRRELSPGTPKVTTKGRTICGDCAYIAEHPGEAVLVAKARQRRKPGSDQLTL